MGLNFDLALLSSSRLLYMATLAESAPGICKFQEKGTQNMYSIRKTLFFPHLENPICQFS